MKNKEDGEEREREKVGEKRLSRIHVALQSRHSTWNLPIGGPHADVVAVCARKLKNSQIRLYITNTQKEQEREEKDLFVDPTTRCEWPFQTATNTNADRERNI
ncbi:hypothetical protein VNO78_22055 [Psophocarpus tetragonolobus]|uniref:Uncharacterized protein n=1 Tax=Psophocarpus tetragonolobus TaxID=3891 RepID=A0AAN9SCN5_PSOTE